MVRIKTNVYSHKRKKRVLKEAKGQFGDRSKRYKEAIKSLIGSRQYAYFDRKKKKGEYRSVWIVRLNAACRESGITYSRFVSGLKAANITLDRKVLADLAVTEPEVFAQILHEPLSIAGTSAESPMIAGTRMAAIISFHGHRGYCRSAACEYALPGTDLPRKSRINPAISGPLVSRAK